MEQFHNCELKLIITSDSLFKFTRIIKTIVHVIINDNTVILQANFPTIGKRKIILEPNDNIYGYVFNHNFKKHNELFELEPFDQSMFNKNIRSNSKCLFGNAISLEIINMNDNKFLVDYTLSAINGILILNKLQIKLSLDKWNVIINNKQLRCNHLVNNNYLLTGDNNHLLNNPSIIKKIDNNDLLTGDNTYSPIITKIDNNDLLCSTESLIKSSIFDNYGSSSSDENSSDNDY